MRTSGGDHAVLDPRDLVDGSVLEEPTAWFHRLLDTAPVWRVPGRDLVVVSSFDTVTEAVRRPDDFSSNIRSVIYRDDDGWPALVSLGFGLTVGIIIASYTVWDARAVGLMAIPPAEEDPEPHFRMLADLAAGHGLTQLSMGMSGDFETAIACGATHVRVGSAIFGARDAAAVAG